ncbi:uncharacterized protein METZ01_LOCUS178614 [marine metagenome]|uniref:Uncharacterized protein n=1 Tax=marine metagenome TaxID=408172 RepID=A0A382CI65_9ZZZZ
MAGALFLFTGCYLPLDGLRIKPWTFSDVHALDGHILNTKEWIKAVQGDMDDLDKIMTKELKFYKKHDRKVYERLDECYSEMKMALVEVDSLTTGMINIILDYKQSQDMSFASIHANLYVSYLALFQTKSAAINKSRKEFSKSKVGLIKGFGKANKGVIFIEDQTSPWKKELYKLKSKREGVQPLLDHFNEVLNESLFLDTESSHSKHIRFLSKKLEKYRVKLDRYEKFLAHVDAYGRKEAGGNVYLFKAGDTMMDYETRYYDGMEQYLDILKQIKKITESI